MVMRPSRRRRSWTDMLLLIPLLPLVGFLVNASLGRRLSKAASGAIACGVMIASFVVSLATVVQLVRLSPASALIERVFTWITSGDFSVGFTLRLDPLASVMILVITGIGSLIHIYSTAYMHEETDSEFARYFSYLNLFAAFMLVLVLASNFLVMFVGWEGVGLCSYLLVGFWFQKKSAADAGKKAFIVNRIGDFGFILGVLLIFVRFGSLDFQEVARSAAMLSPETTFGAVSLMTLLLFVGATGKSAQIPLYVWLPDAMEGPTPVSALIHAATMVTAGVYMIGRNAVLFQPRAADADDRRDHRRRHGAHGRHDRARAERHQARAGLLDRVAARLHVPRDGRRRVRVGHLSSLHARILQSAAVPRVGRRHSRARRRAGHAAHGRIEERAADHVLDVRDWSGRDFRRAGVCRLLQQGRDSLRGPSRAGTRCCG